MPMDYPTYITQLNDALVAENGPTLAYLLRPTSPHGKELVKYFKNQDKQTLLKRWKGSIQSPWDEIAIEYIVTCIHLAKKRIVEAFTEQNNLVTNFAKFFNDNRGWTLPALFSILRDLRDLADQADQYCITNGQNNGQQSQQYMRQAATTINAYFGRCMTDRTSPPEQSRKWGIYYIVGLMLKSYFRVKTINLSRQVLRALDNSTDIPSIHQYPKSHQVTYRYYIGMIGFLNEDYVKAELELTVAFYQCHLLARSNQERILTYLIPLRILKGHLPTSELLSRFPNVSALYSPFIAAIRTGNILGYDRALERWEQRLLELNLWLTLEKARELCLRSLFRKVWVVTDKSSRIPISLFHSALKISGSEIDVEEAECLLANTIYRGFLRGYISHEKQTVVLAQTNAFPRLVDLPNPYSTM